MGLLTLFTSLVVLIPLIGYFVDIPYFNFISNEKDLIFNIEGKTEPVSVLIYILYI